MKRTFLAIGSLALAVLLGLTMIGNGVDAQDTATPAAGESTTVGEQTTETKESARDAYLAALAANLGISPEELQAAVDTTNTELDVHGGVMDGMGGRGHGGGRDDERGGAERTIERGGGSLLRGVALDDAAAFLGLTEDELKTEANGTGFLEIALAHGKTTEEVRAFLIQQATDQIDERLQAASDAPAGAESAEPATENSSISEATEVPTAPALTPTATA